MKDDFDSFPISYDRNDNVITLTLRHRTQEPSDRMILNGKDISATKSRLICRPARHDSTKFDHFSTISVWRIYFDANNGFYRALKHGLLAQANSSPDEARNP